jgi:hypothetical protein
MLRVHHEIVAALDNNSCSILVMLDLSAAFHVIDNGIFYQRLEYTFGISGSALAWIKPYLSDRSQQIAIHWFCFVGFPRNSQLVYPKVQCSDRDSTAYFRNQLVTFVKATIWTIIATPMILKFTS